MRKNKGRETKQAEEKMKRQKKIQKEVRQRDKASGRKD